MATDREPSPGELWRQAGGGTPSYDRDTYLQLMTEHGYLIPLKPGETRAPLPCGWPGRRATHVTVDEPITTEETS